MPLALRSAVALTGLLWLAAALAQQPVPPLTARVVDTTGTLPPERVAALERTLAAFEERTGSQIAVLIVPTTAPEPVEAYAIRVAEAWQLGREGVDDGILLLVAKDDRQLRIEVGYGLEGAVPDALANRIIDERIVPRFYREDYAGGIEAGVDALIGLAEGEPLPPPAGTAIDGDRFGAVPFLLFAALVLAPLFRRLFGRLLGAVALGGLAGAVAWLMANVVIVGLAVGFVVFMIALGGTTGPGRWASGGWRGGIGRGGFGGGFGGGGFGGGGFRGGGGRFGGGGASGRW